MIKEIKSCLTTAVFVALALGFAGLGLTTYQAYQTKTGIFRPPRQPTAQEIARAELSKTVRFYVGNGFLILLGGGVGLGIVGVGLFAFNKGINERRLIYADKETGLFPVVTEDVAPWYYALVGFRNKVERDFNKAIAPNRQLIATPRGRTSMRAALEEGIGAEAYERQAARVATTQTQVARARSQRGGGLSMHDARLQSGYYSEEAARMAARRERAEAEARAAEGRLIGRYDEQPEAEVVQAPPMDASAALTFAVNRFKRGAEEMPVGQEEDGPRDVALWTPKDTSVVAIVGANGTGKTSNAAAALVNAAILWRWHVVVMAPEDKFADWTVYGEHAERHIITAHNFPYAVAAILREYKRRAALQRSHNVAHNQDLADGVRSPKVLFVFEEFGSTYRNALTLLKSKDAAKLDVMLSDLFSLTRHADHYYGIIDQRPAKWPDGMKGNVKQVIGYALKLNQGQAVEMYKLGKLPRRGAFHTDTDGEASTYRSWLMLNYASAVCRRVPPSGYGPILDLPVVRVANDGELFTNGQANGVSSGTNGTNDKSATPAGGEIMADLGGVYERSRRSWDAVAVAYFKHKDAERSQAELRRIMAALGGKDADAYKSEAADLFHTYADDGDRSKSRRVKRGAVYTAEDLVPTNDQRRQLAKAMKGK